MPQWGTFNYTISSFTRQLLQWLLPLVKPPLALQVLLRELPLLLVLLLVLLGGCGVVSLGYGACLLVLPEALPMMAASVKTRVVSWNDAAEINESVDNDAFVIPRSMNS